MNAKETLGQQGQIGAALQAGVDTLGTRQTVCFTKYTKYIASLDGYVFWVATSQQTTVTGVLHLAIDRVQDEDQTAAQNTIFLTSEEPITEFNDIEPTAMWIGAWPLGAPGNLVTTLKVAFAHQTPFFGPTETHHYMGIAVWPALESQLVQSAADIPEGPIVSNSLPIWRALPFVNAGITVPVVPSFVSPDNLAPPYVVAHIEPDETIALTSAPAMIWPGTVIPDSGSAPLHSLPISQLCRDEVDLILYGFTNAMAIKYLAMLREASLEQELFGFANSPVPRDEKRTQSEISAIAMKKKIHISANYLQGTADVLERRLILEAGITVTVNQV